jgi:hypothetical protein
MRKSAKTEKVRYRERDYGAEREFILDLVLLKDRAAKLGLWQTFAALDEVTTVVGFECGNTVEK